MSNSQESNDSSESATAKQIESEHDYSVLTASKTKIPKSAKSTGAHVQNEEVTCETNTSHLQAINLINQEVATEDPTTQTQNASSSSSPRGSTPPPQPVKRKRGRPPTNPDQPRDYACTYPTCPAKFARRYTLQQHMRIHTQSKPYECDFPLCQERFRQLSHLKQHQRYHTGERPFKCDTCGKSFFQSTNLVGHRCSKTQASDADVGINAGGYPADPVGEYEEENGDIDEDGLSQPEIHPKLDSALETFQDDSHNQYDVDHKLDPDEDEIQP